jgi:hypothetical protein
MKVNELRIGNLVNYEQTNHKITSISDLGFITSIWLGNNDMNDEYSHSITELKSIPLTEEWLLKFGFIKSLHEGYYDKKWLSGDFFFDGKKLLVITEGLINGDFPGILYVHQLQNLYFALTGEELEFQPSFF